MSDTEQLSRIESIGPKRPRDLWGMIRKAPAIGVHNDKTQKSFTRLKERLSIEIQTD